MLALPKHLFEPVADSICNNYMVCSIHHKFTPSNKCPMLLDFFLVNFLRLPPCDGALCSQPGADMVGTFRPRFGPGVPRQFQPLAHFDKKSPSLTSSMTCCAAKARVISIRTASDISDGKANSHSRAVTELERISRASAVSASTPVSSQF